MQQAPELKLLSLQMSKTLFWSHGSVLLAAQTPEWTSSGSFWRQPLSFYILNAAVFTGPFSAVCESNYIYNVLQIKECIFFNMVHYSSLSYLSQQSVWCSN